MLVCPNNFRASAVNIDFSALVGDNADAHYRRWYISAPMNRWLRGDALYELYCFK
jgi:hypothetical protein